MQQIRTNEQARIAQKEMEQFWQDLDNESDRGMVLSAVSYFEKVLEDCLNCYFVDSGITKNLLKSGSGLGSFSARNSCCVGLRIITPQEYQCLKLMAGIRNIFAHKILANFTDGSIADKILELTRGMFEENVPVWKKIKTGPPREQFTFSAFCLNDLIWLRAYDVSIHVENYPSLIPDHANEILDSSTK